LPDKHKDNPGTGYVLAQVCDERTKRLEGKIDDLKRGFEKVDKRTWWILGSVVLEGFVAILIAILNR